MISEVFKWGFLFLVVYAACQAVSSSKRQLASPHQRGNNSDGYDNNHKCVICDNLVNERDPTSCLSCGHKFHKECYEIIKTEKTICPNCRNWIGQ